MNAGARADFSMVAFALTGCPLGWYRAEVNPRSTAKKTAKECRVDERALATIRSWPKHFDRMMVRAETMVSA